MAGDDKKTKTDPAPKKEPAAKDKGAPPPADKGASPAKDKGASPPADKSTPATDTSKPVAADAPVDPAAGYSRGEGQKPVSKAYKDNWNAIFGKKKKR